MKKLISLILILFSLFIVSGNFLFAANPSCNTNGLTTVGIDILSDPTGKSCANLTEKSDNLLTNTVASKVYVIVKVILGFSATIGLVVFVYAGVIILISKGNPDAYKKGTNLIKYTFGGIIIIIFSYAIVSFLTTTIPGVTGGASSGDASGSSVPCTTNSDCTQTDYYCHSWSAPIVCTKVVSGDICDTTGKCYKTDDTVNIGSKTSSPNGFCGGGKISGWGCYK